MSDNIELEVQKRMAQATRLHHQEIEQHTTAIQGLQKELVQLVQVVQRLECEPFYFGTLVKIQNIPDPIRFCSGDKIVVVSVTSPHYGKAGHIVSYDPVVTDAGKVAVQLADGIAGDFYIGINGNLAEIRLAQKSDGTSAIINVDGHPWEVRGAPDLELSIGDPIKITSETKQIVSKGPEDLISGSICVVDAVTEAGIEVSDKGERKFVKNARSFSLEIGDKVVVDPGFFVITKKLEKNSRERYKLLENSDVSWDEIGGLDAAKLECREAIEMPFQYPELFEFYGKEKTRGILLFGPPGCGKTLLARAMATSLCKMHGKGSTDSGYIYVKSPELLNKWVGNTEAEIRNLFEFARKHFREHKFPALLVLDEFDAIAPQRGSRRSSDIADTIVPMFLGEMDGVDSQQTAENPIVVVMTNRADVIDPAVTRNGRIDKHIKIQRPTAETAMEILQIRSRKIPFAEPQLGVMAVTVQDIFSKNRLLYRVNNEHDFTFGDTISGAILGAVCEEAKMKALHRDLATGAKSGVKLEDFRYAVDKIYNSQRGVNHAYDLSDFAEAKGIQAKDMKVDRCFSN